MITVGCLPTWKTPTINERSVTCRCHHHHRCGYSASTILNQQEIHQHRSVAYPDAYPFHGAVRYRMACTVSAGSVRTAQDQDALIVASRDPQLQSQDDEHQHRSSCICNCHDVSPVSLNASTLCCCRTGASSSAYRSILICALGIFDREKNFRQNPVFSGPVAALQRFLSLFSILYSLSIILPISIEREISIRKGLGITGKKPGNFRYFGNFRHHGFSHGFFQIDSEIPKPLRFFPNVQRIFPERFVLLFQV